MSEQAMHRQESSNDHSGHSQTSLPRSLWRAWLTAIGFLTRLPVGRAAHSPTSADLNRAPVFFPLVGGAIGAFVASLSFAGCQIWSPSIAVIVALTAELLLTGAFHEDALADFCDAFGGGSSREDVLRILKDSRIGAFGAVSLFVGILIRFACLCSLLSSTETNATALFFASTIASAAIGRWTILLTMSFVAPAPGREGLASRMFSGPSLNNLVLSSVIVLLACSAWGWLAPVNFAAAVLALLLVVPGFIFYVRARIGGMTGDCLGCQCYLAQMVVLLAAAAHAP